MGESEVDKERQSRRALQGVLQGARVEEHCKEVFAVVLRTQLLLQWLWVVSRQPHRAVWTACRLDGAREGELLLLEPSNM